MENITIKLLLKATDGAMTSILLRAYSFSILRMVSIKSHYATKQSTIKSIIQNVKLNKSH